MLHGVTMMASSIRFVAVELPSWCAFNRDQILETEFELISILRVVWLY